uniref:Putative reverse transcriptase, RNA-dependent DNA polymerase n=1 Tax=Tanacetum cinerariifolium TaxID=118510 RepID=A0A699HSK8_TANCI|nr:putative reverse transcriptase, RNA-dependent DNA polymerase [Tanacetum cinerariifolium]
MIDCKPIDTPIMVNQKLYMEEKAKLADKGRPIRKHCGTWDWYDPELEHDWYRFKLFDMNKLLNPQQRYQHQAEMRREERIQDLTHLLLVLI